MDTANLQPRGRVGLSALSTVALAVVVLAPAAASWHGLVAAGREVLMLGNGWELLVPLTLDSAALYAATLALRAVLSSDSAFGARVLTALYAAAASGINAYHAHSSGGSLVSSAYYAGMSLSAVVLWDVTLRHWRRDQLREKGHLEQPLPRFRALRWVVAPLETGRAWRLAVLQGITDPREALERANSTSCRVTVAANQMDSHNNSALTSVDYTTERTETDEQGSADAEGRGRTPEGADDAGDLPGDRIPGDRGPGRSRLEGGRGFQLVLPRASASGGDLLRGDLSGALKADAGVGERLRIAAETRKATAVHECLDLLGEKDVPTVLAVLKAHGVTVDRSYAYSAADQWQPKATGGER